MADWSRTPEAELLSQETRAILLRARLVLREELTRHLGPRQRG